jgi:hypothetical protein
MKIAILTLASQRDKLIDEMLADELKSYGHEVTRRCFIYAGRETITYEKPDAVVVPMPGGQYKLDFIKKCKKWGIEVIVRRGEAGMGLEQFDKLSKDRQSIILGNWNYQPYVDLELTWGQEFTDILHERGHNPVRRRACGAFAFDPYFHIKPTNDLPRKRTILFATGFSTADCRSDYCECGLPEESEYHKDIYDVHRGARDTWIDSISELVKWFGDDWAFELKVRPGEMPTEYIQSLPESVKVHPIDSASSEILKNVDILVHSGSTLAVEAHLLDIPAFNYCNVNPDPLLSKVSPVLETHKELEFNLERTMLGRSNIVEPILHELKTHLYGDIDGKAYKRAAKHIHEQINGKFIRTRIPNAWPKEVMYPDDNVFTEVTEGCVSFLCPCCRNQYYVKAGIERAKCPYCSMGIVRSEHKIESVLK